MAPTSKLLRLLPVDRKPPAKAMMDRFAPNTAALETPSVEGDAIALFSVVCMIRPETDSPAPAMMAASTLGTRIFQMILVWEGVPFPAKAFMASRKLRLDEPTNRHPIPNTTTAMAIVRMITVFRLFFF